MQKDHQKSLRVLDIPRSEKHIRRAIGSGMLDKNNFFVVEEKEEVIGFIEQKRTNNSHIMLGYPYVDLSHPDRGSIQEKLLKETLSKLKKFGYQIVSTQVSKQMYEGIDLYAKLGFDNPKPVFQAYDGVISPNFEIEIDPYSLRRVRSDDLDITYSWIKRQLNPMSPIYISKKDYARMLSAPREVREGWSMATVDGKPIAFISSMIDSNTGEVVIFGPFNHPNHTDIRIPLFNELLLHHKMRGKSYLRLMRIDLFDNDKDLIEEYNLEMVEKITVLSKTL